MSLFKIITFLFFISCSAVELDHGHKEDVKSELIQKIKQREKERSRVPKIYEKKKSDIPSSILLINKNKSTKNKIDHVVKLGTKTKKVIQEEKIPEYLRDFKEYFFQKL